MTPEARRAVLLASYAHLLCHGAKVVLQVSLAVAALQFGVGLAAMALALTAYNVGMGLAAIPAGLLSDRLGPTRVLVLYFWALAGAALLCAGVPGYAGFVAAHGLLGLAAGLYHPPGLSLISLSSSRHEMGPAMGLHGVFGNVGIMCAPLAVALLAPLWGWRAAFVALAALCVCGALTAAWMRSHGLVLAGPTHEEHGADDDRLSRRGLALLLFVLCVNAFVLDGFTPLFPLTISAQHAGAFEPRLLDAAILSLGVLGQWVGGLLARGAGQPRRFLNLLLLQMAALLAAASLVATSWAGMLPLALFAFANYAMQPMENRILATFTSSRRRSSAYALKFTVALLLAAPAGPLVGLLLERADARAAYVVLAITALLGVVGWRLLVRRLERAPA